MPTIKHAKQHQALRPAISYLRFSTKEQQRGRSQKRQLERAERYAKENRLKLQDDLRFVDKGVSGHHGQNRKRGDFGRLLELVASGEIARGTALVVESISRLSREKFLDAFDSISQILRAGIAIHTIQDGMVYDETSVQSKIQILVNYMTMAHDESQLKADLLRDARHDDKLRARHGNETITRMLPAWIMLDDDGRRLLRPKAKATIRKAFRMKLDGIGTDRMARLLNQDPTAWRPARRVRRKKELKQGTWRGSYIKKLLGDRRLLGEMQPCRTTAGRNSPREPDGKPIQNYYPVVIEQHVFNAVQTLLAKNRGKGGRTGAITNLFQRIVKCGYCGASMVLVVKHRTKGEVYLQCDNAHRGLGCTVTRFRYSEIESLVLDNCPKLDPTTILPPREDAQKKVAKKKEELAKINDRVNDTNRRLANLESQMSDSPSKSYSTRLDRQMRELDAEKIELLRKQADCDQELAQLTRDARNLQTWQRDIASLRSKMNDPDVRAKVRLKLPEWIESVEVFSVGRKQLGPKKQPVEDWADWVYDMALEYAPDMTRHKHWKGFIRYLRGRRGTRDARCIRLHVVGARYPFELVPAGSLALGRQFNRKERVWGFIWPDIDLWWKRYLKRPSCQKGGNR